LPEKPQKIITAHLRRIEELKNFTKYLYVAEEISFCKEKFYVEVDLDGEHHHFSNVES
jgi:hypothetical protein